MFRFFFLIKLKKKIFQLSQRDDLRKYHHYLDIMATILSRKRKSNYQIEKIMEFADRIEAGGALTTDDYLALLAVKQIKL